MYNAADVFLVLIFFLYAIEGYSLGFVASFFEFVSFVLSFTIGLRGYLLLVPFLSRFLPVPHGFLRVISFFLITSLSEILLRILIRKIFPSILYFFSAPKVSRFLQKANSVLGIFPGLASCYVLLSFVLTVLVSLPISTFLTKAVSKSFIGEQLVSRTHDFEKNLNDIFGQAVVDTLNFLTISPKSSETINLHFQTRDFRLDKNAEKEMVSLVNKERTKKGLVPLLFDNKLTEVARSHAIDMITKGYFSHYSKDGRSPFDRMDSFQVVYSAAGENLAFAPSVQIAMQGLMDSQGHKANMLSTAFGKIGIGVIDAGVYGLMFAQEFSD